MTGASAEGEQSAPRSGQSAAVLSSWIDEQLRDIQSAQVTRLTQLRARLQSGAFECDSSLLARAVELLCEEASRLDFEPLRKRGLLSKLWSASSGRRAFGEQHQRAVAAAKGVKACSEELAKNYTAQMSGARRVLLELDMEQQTMARDVGQAVEWLAEMSEDMAARLHASGKNAALTLLLKRAEFFTGHLKSLHVLQEQAESICKVGQSVLDRRTALLEQVKSDLDGYNKVWLHRVGRVAEQATAGVPVPILDKGEAAHVELVSRLKKTQAAAQALQLEEYAMGVRLAAWRKGLEELS